MGGWGEFGLAIVSFFLSHTVPAQAGIRDHLTDRLGQRGYAVIYSLVSLLILGWVLSAAGRAPYVQVIPPWEILRWAPLVLMPFACLVAVAGMLVQNPFSFGGLGRTAFDPDNPGILAVTRHPLLLALLIWSLAHMLANG
ncbi:MAG: NnrU family protein, partial [Pseudomonadota bacterium]